MRAIDHFNLRSFDLNLLLSFDALVQELNVTKAAARLHVQQPAMSHALSTLRLLLQDPLFVRVGTRMEPTPRALSLAVVVRKILHDAQEALLHREDFDPAHTECTVRLGINMQMESLLIPALVAQLRTHAPGVTVITSPVRSQSVFEMLDNGSIDVGIGYLPGGLSWHMRMRVAEVDHLCCFNERLLGMSAPIGLEQYRASAHGLLSAKNNALGYLEESFERAAIVPRVAISSPNFMTLAHAAAQAPIVVTLAEPVARQCAALYGLSLSSLPFAIDKHVIDLVWHARSAGDPVSEWLRKQIVEIVTGPNAAAA